MDGTGRRPPPPSPPPEAGFGPADAEFQNARAPPPRPPPSRSASASGGCESAPRTPLRHRPYPADRWACSRRPLQGESRLEPAKRDSCRGRHHPQQLVRLTQPGGGFSVIWTIPRRLAAPRRVGPRRGFQRGPSRRAGRPWGDFGTQPSPLLAARLRQFTAIGSHARPSPLPWRNFAGRPTASVHFRTCPNTSAHIRPRPTNDNQRQCVTPSKSEHILTCPTSRNRHKRITPNAS